MKESLTATDRGRAVVGALLAVALLQPVSPAHPCAAEPRLKIARAANLSPEQARIQDEMIAAVQDTARADAIYDRIEDSMGGKVIGSDAARFLARDYDTLEGRIRNTPATSNAAVAYADDRYMRVIARPPPPKEGHPRPIVLFTAGGVASGKTTSISKEVFDRASLVRDGTMRDVPKAVKEIQAALDNGWDVVVTYIQRPFDLVVDGAIDRAARTGRWGPLAQLPEIHMVAQRSFTAVADHFRSNPRVDLRALYNTWSPARPEPAREIPVSSVAEDGELRYRDVRELERILRERFQAAQESGTYPADLLDLLGQGIPGKAFSAPDRRRDHRDDDREPVRRPEAQEGLSGFR